MFCANRNLNFFNVVPSDESTRHYFLANGSVEEFRQAVLDLTSRWDIEGWDCSAADEALMELTDLFAKGSQFLQALDTPYHDTRHTLQVVLCWCRMVDRFLVLNPDNGLSGRLLQLGFNAALFHDSGYLKDHDDGNGSGAKLAAIHERRSCRFARDNLAKRLLSDSEVKSLQRMIVATGPRALIPAIPFSCENERRLGQMLASADFLAQLSDPDYPQKLVCLFNETREAESRRHFPRSLPQLESIDAFRAATQSFWSDFVRPHLDGACGAVHRYLNQPYPDGENAYLQAIAKNLQIVGGFSPEVDRKI